MHACGCAGLVGYLRVSVEEHTVIETKPENRLEDLRLNAPWPELQQFASKFNFNSMDDAAHKHVPWGVILIQVGTWQTPSTHALYPHIEQAWIPLRTRFYVFQLSEFVHASSTCVFRKDLHRSEGSADGDHQMRCAWILYYVIPELFCEDCLVQRYISAHDSVDMAPCPVG